METAIATGITCPLVLPHKIISLLGQSLVLRAIGHVMDVGPIVTS